MVPTLRNTTVAATVNGKPILSAEVERLINNRQGGSNRNFLTQLAQARLQVLDKLIQREVLFQRAERESLLPTEDQINARLMRKRRKAV